MERTGKKRKKERKEEAKKWKRRHPCFYGGSLIFLIREEMALFYLTPNFEGKRMVMGPQHKYTSNIEVYPSAVVHGVVPFYPI